MFIEKLSKEEVLELMKRTCSESVYSVDFDYSETLPIIFCVHFDDLRRDIGKNYIDYIVLEVNDFTVESNMGWSIIKMYEFYDFMIEKFGEPYLVELLAYKQISPRLVKKFFTNEPASYDALDQKSWDGK